VIIEPLDEDFAFIDSEKLDCSDIFNTSVQKNVDGNCSLGSGDYLNWNPIVVKNFTDFELIESHNLTLNRSSISMPDSNTLYLINNMPPDFVPSSKCMSYQFYDQGRCIDCHQNCLICQNSSSCDYCEFGFALNSTNECEPCNNHCESCEIFDGT